MKKTKKKKSSKKSIKPKRKTSSINDSPLQFGKSCFNKTTLDSRGFQAADLKPKYFKIYTDLLVKHGQKLMVKPTGNPGISLSVSK